MFLKRVIQALRGGGESQHNRIPYLVFGGLTYPLWHLITPEGARDPWAAWWAVGSTFVLVTLAITVFPRLAPLARGLFTVCAALVTTHIFILATLNGMQPFYAVGSSLAIVTTTISIRSKPVLLAYAAYVAVIGTVLYALDPDTRKLAYWGGMFPILALAYQRLSAQITAIQAAQEYQERLERDVEERTADLAEANRRLRREINERARLEEELRLAQKMEAVGRLAGGVAHEFNNLLTTIRLYAELTRDALPEDSPLHPELQYILKAGRQASNLTQQLLAFSRREEAVAEVLDLNQIVSDNVSMLRHLLGEDVHLICDLDESTPVAIRAGRGEVEQVLVNLALNARDAMPDGGRVTVSTGIVRRDTVVVEPNLDVAANGEFAVLTVADTGIGMDPETRSRAFDPFFTRKQVGEGTGLGLTIVYGVMHQRDGHVRVTSEPGKGARFDLWWPVVDAPLEELREATSAAADGGQGERILLVEDEADLRMALARVLAHVGYEVVQAGDAESALALAEAGPDPFELVITDVVMPRMSGLELVERLAAARYPAPVLLISGQLNHPSLREQPLPEDVRLLRKPFDGDALIGAVRGVLAGETAPATGGAARPARPAPPSSARRE